jgi:transcriptional regulator with XRE-family HTH domain
MTTPLGYHARAWREYLGLRQAEVASRAGISAIRLCRIEKGTRRATFDEALALAKAMGLTLEQISDMPPATIDRSRHP